MNGTSVRKLGFSSAAAGLAIIAITSVVLPQKNTTRAVSLQKATIFAVLNNGTMIEPIAHIENRTLAAPVNGSDDSSLIAAFTKLYYKPKSAYSLIFGGANVGSVTVGTSDSSIECAPNMANVNFTSAKVKLKGMVMALATNAVIKKPGSGVRRLPTSKERSEIESLVRAELSAKGVSTRATSNLKYHNLTALDVDRDGQAELVGSFWIDSSPKSRSLLFLIAEKGSTGKYSLGFSEFENITEDQAMSGDIADVDRGVYHELLLDAFDFDDDGLSEIFTYTQSFEGAGFNAYDRKDGKWFKAFEGSNYHCGY